MARLRGKALLGVFRLWVKRALFYLNDVAAVIQYALHGFRPRQGLTILCYHRTAQGLPRRVPFNPYNVDLQVFLKQLETIAAMKAITIVSAGQVARWLEGEVPPHGSYLLLTFDDIWQNNLSAARALASRGMPAAFFVPTAHIGKEVFSFSAFDVWCKAQSGADPDWYTPIRAEDLPRLRSLKIEVQPHSHAHRSLGSMSSAEMEDDIRQSVAIVRQAVGEDPVAFAYPYGSTMLGDVPLAAATELKRQGIVFAVATDAGCNRLADLRRDAYRLRRIPVNPYDVGLFIRAKAAGFCGPLSLAKSMFHRLPGMKAVPHANGKGSPDMSPTRQRG